MRFLLMSVAAACVWSGSVWGAQPEQPNEHLKDLAPFIGTWRFEGPSPEAVPGFVELGTPCKVQFSWRWILDKKAVMYDLQVEYEGGKRVSQKELIGWNAAEKEIVSGGLNSIGIVQLGTMQVDAQAKTLTIRTQGVNAEGGESTGEAVFTKVDKDTLTFKRLALTGSIVEGPSPVYTLKRVKPAKGKKIVQ
jgi:hypothetical protein